MTNKKILLIGFLMCSYISYGQTNEELEAIKNNPVQQQDSVHTMVEQMPEFPGGNMEMNIFLRKNILYPFKELQNGISGTVYVSFIVEKDGSITDVKIMKGVAGGPGLSREALRVVRLMPNWSPGKQGGKLVRTIFTLPIKFNAR